jgi:hypothetical protein
MRTADESPLGTMAAAKITRRPGQRGACPGAALAHPVHEREGTAHARPEASAGRRGRLTPWATTAAPGRKRARLVLWKQDPPRSRNVASSKLFKGKELVASRTAGRSGGLSPARAFRSRGKMAARGGGRAARLHEVPSPPDAPRASELRLEHGVPDPSQRCLSLDRRMPLWERDRQGLSG